MFLLPGLCVLLTALSLVRPSTSEQSTVLPYEREVHVPRCCAYGHALSASGTCVAAPKAQFTPTLYLEDKNVRAVNVAKDPPTKLACEPQEELASLSMSRAQAILFLRSPDAPVQLAWYPPGVSFPVTIDTFCVGTGLATLRPADTDTEYIAQFCYQSQTISQSSCGSRYCTRKCCPEDQELLNKECTPVPSNAQPWQPVYTSVEDPSVPLTPHPELGRAFGIPQCSQMLPYRNFTLDPKGDLYVPGSSPLFHTHYCLDRFSSDGVETTDLALVCVFTKPPPDCVWKSRILDPILLGVSCFFLLVTAVVYLSLPGLRASLNGRCLVAFVLSIFLSFVAFLVLKTSRDSMGSSQCIFTAMFALVFTLASFFWFNILCFRMWSDLRDPRQEKNGACWFVALCGYGFGCPLLVALIGHGLDVAEADAIRPHFKDNCWFGDESSRWAYQYGILLALLVVDLALFVWSVVLLARRHNTWMIQRTSAANQGFVLFFWLFIIMSISWTIEIITWQVGGGCSVGSIIADVINALQGFFIFLAAVCFRRDLKLQGKWWVRVPTEDQDATNGRYATSNAELETRTKEAE